ncbi:nucleoside deaminase [Pelagibacterium lacus]|uniref:Nucleoside deaminase n=1 Tax=Pelagibacterium lacus TaxID=2282655 RepID=A0A369W611_9HYPH|nr:nucleoside deaminase [Pelagibacterium lacus]RDE10104.1 nucleoside deaminase [Pelagibacterium lacus]
MTEIIDRKYLKRCIELAQEALAAGSPPFGALLVSAEGNVIFEDRNRGTADDRTQHPELAIARWAAQNMAPHERAKATVYTTAEHCAMCAAAHGWAGLGRIVYISSSEQLTRWHADLEAPASKVRVIPIREVVDDIVVDGPFDELAEQVRQLLVQFYTRSPQ